MAVRINLQSSGTVKYLDFAVRQVLPLSKRLERYHCTIVNGKDFTPTHSQMKPLDKCADE